MNIPKALLAELFDGENAYPIYQVELKWSQDIPADRPTDRFTRTDGLPEGRMWNGHGWSMMPAERTSENELLGDARDQMTNAFGGEKYKGTNPADLEATIKFQRWETWCLSWFAHWTWDTGLDDIQVLDSFRNYVWRTEEANRKKVKVGDIWIEPYPLMGAEDRYRWTGTTTGDPNEQADPPCRCQHCQNRGILIIGH